MEEVIPKIKEKDSINIYINDKIHKLQQKQTKNKILTKIHRLQRKWPASNSRIMKNLKKEINSIRTELKIEFSNSINNY